MRPAQVHLPSVLAGAGAVALVLGLVSMMQAPSHIPPFQIQGIPTPQQMMRVVEGTPFTVPAGKVFVLTGLGDNGIDSVSVTLFVDGVAEVSGSLDPGCWPTLPSILPVPSGLAVKAGSDVEVTGTGSGPVSRAWGYLADA